MGCCVSRIINKKVDPVPDSVNTVALRPSPSRSQRIPRRENVVVHRSVESTYNVLASIGRGAFGHVVRVEHMKTKKPYAIKIIDLRRNAAKHEIEILKTVDHRYVIKLHDVITTPGKLYLVMDLATGGELFDRIHLLGNFDENDAIRVLRMILDGIRYLHSVGITHRDLKPENILYYHPGNNSSIIITDFGLSAIRKPSANSLMNTDCGTVEYMAPEVIVRDPYTNTVDMWSIGVITFILLSGKLPFPIRGNMFSLLRTICFGKFSYEGEPWQSISAEAKDFINSLLIVEPKKRLTASEALEHRWIKERQRSRKRNLQRSISSNWTESCLSLSSVLSKNGRTRNNKESKERVNVNENKARASKNYGSTAKKVSKVRTNAVYDTIDSECQASDETSDAPKRSVEASHRRKRDQVSKTSVEASAKKYIHVQATKECAEGEDTTSSGSNLVGETIQQCCKNDATERTLLKEHVGIVENKTQISRGVVRLPPLKSPITPMSTWSEDFTPK